MPAVPFAPNQSAYTVQAFLVARQIAVSKATIAHYRQTSIMTSYASFNRVLGYLQGKELQKEG
jgi:hypothetical protein